MTITEIIALALAGIQTAGTDKQIAQIVDWLSLGLKFWGFYGETSAEFKAIADRTKVLNDGGWQIDAVKAEYATAQAGLEADLNVLHGPPA